MATSDEALAALRAAIDRDPDASHRLAHGVTVDLLDRAERIPPEQSVLGWEQLPDAAAALVGADAWPMRVAVTANMMAVASFAEPTDFLTLDRLLHRYGHRAIAKVQDAADTLLATGPGLPLATGYARAVARSAEIADGLVAIGTEPETAAEVAERSASTGFWLILADIDPDTAGRELTQLADVVRCADVGGIRAWRAQIAIIAANPWAPYPTELVTMMKDAGRLTYVAALEAAIALYRDRAEQHDRQLVAREVRKLVALSGLSQRQFAAMCGTSAPRLSTYVNGLVTPSASMMVRFRRASERAQKDARRVRGSTA
jgi:hypothetical protein